MFNLMSHRLFRAELFKKKKIKEKKKPTDFAKAF